MRIFIIIALIVFIILFVTKTLVKGERFSTYTLPALLTLAMVLIVAETSHQYSNMQMSQVVKAISGNEKGYAECQRVSETLFDTKSDVGGMVNWDNPNRAILKYTQCNQAISWLKQGDKNTATLEQIGSIGILIHESYHVSGEMDEKVTECLNAKNIGNVMERLGASPEKAKEYQVQYYQNYYVNMPEKYLDPTCFAG